MSNVKLLPTRILQVIPSQYCDVPYPVIAYQDQSGTNSSAEGDNKIVSLTPVFATQDSSGNEINIVNPGDVIYFEVIGVAATVVEVLSRYEIVINANFLVDTDPYTYTIYQNSLFPNQGCQLFFPDGYDQTIEVVVSSAGRDNRFDTDGINNGGYSFKLLNPNTPLPLQVVKVWECSTDIFALW
jgi:hypothetical protein